MPTFKLPLSGDVTQTLNPWTLLFHPVGSQIGLLNVSLGMSADPRIEQRVIEDVASYGRQLGRIGDALAVLLTHFRPERALTAEEEHSLRALRRMLDDIADIKRRPPPADPA